MKKFSLFLATLFMSMLLGVSANAQDAIQELDPLEISNLTTEEMTVEGQTYLLLMGSNDMWMAEVTIFLNNYTGEDKAYEVNAENSVLTYGGIELLIQEGTMTQTTIDGEVSFLGNVIASAEEEGEVLVVSLDLIMKAVAPIEVVIEDAVARVDEGIGALVLTAEWTIGDFTYPVFLTVAGYEDVEYMEYAGAQISEIQIGDDANWFDYAVANNVVVTKYGTVVSVEGKYTSFSTGTTYTVIANGVMQGGDVDQNPDSEYTVYEDEITNLVIDYDNMLLTGGPSEAFQIEVVLGLGDYDMNTGIFQLNPESMVSVQGSDATFVEGYAYVDGIDQTAQTVVKVVWNEMYIEFHLAMSAAPLEATVVVVEDATVEVEKVLLFGDMYDYALKMTGVWTNEGVDYPVLVEVPVYYPEATEPSTIYSTVTVGGMGDDDPWFGFGEGDLTITTVDGVVTAQGVVSNPGVGLAIDITISGKLSADTALDNVQMGVKAVKAVKNGQLVITIDNVDYNATGAVVK